MVQESNQNVNAPTFNVSIGHPAPAARPHAEPSPRTQKPLPNIQYIGAETVSLEDVIGRGLVERGSAQNAIIIRFANEATPGAQNLRARVRAVLIYRYEQKEVDVAGSWLYENSDVSDFAPDGRRHKLIAGIIIDGELAAITAQKFVAHRRTWYMSDSLPLKGFQTGTVFVQLTNVHTLDVLYQNEFAVRVNPLSITSPTTR